MMELTPFNTILIAVISGLLSGGLFTGLGTLIKGRGGATKDIGEAATQMVEQYRLQVAELRAELNKVKERLIDLEKIAQILDEVIAGAHLLVHQVKSLRAVPVYLPPERRDDAQDHKAAAKARARKQR